MSVEKEIQALVEKDNKKISYEIVFPQYNILPDEVKLALSVLAKHGMKIYMVLKDKK